MPLTRLLLETGAIRAGFPHRDAGSPDADIAYDSLVTLAIKSEAMTISEIYRARSATLAELAKSASAPKYKDRFERMALVYERLAERFARPVRVHQKKAQARPDHRKAGSKSKSESAPQSARLMARSSKGNGRI